MRLEHGLTLQQLADRLQIAFEHVWQDVVDEEVIGAAQDLHRSLRERGGRPSIRPGVDPRW